MNEISMKSLKNKVYKYEDNLKSSKKKQRLMASFDGPWWGAAFFNYIHIKGYILGKNNNIYHFLKGHYMTKYDIAKDIHKSPRTINRMLTHKGNNKHWINNVIKIHRIKGIGLHYYNDEGLIKLNKRGHTYPLGLKRPTLIVDDYSYLDFINHKYDPIAKIPHFSQSYLVKMIAKKDNLLQEVEIALEHPKDKENLKHVELEIIKDEHSTRIFDVKFPDFTNLDYLGNLRTNTCSKFANKINKKKNKLFKSYNNHILHIFHKYGNYGLWHLAPLPYPRYPL